MNDCSNGDIRDLLPDLLHGRLTESERDRVKAHVRSCATCEAELDLLRDLRATMGRSPAIDARAMAAAIPAYRAPVARSWGGWRAAAAIVALLGAGASIALVNRHPGVGNVAQVEAPSSSAGTPSASSAVPGVVPSPPAQSPVAQATSPRFPEAPARAPSAASAQELAMAGGVDTELSDRELSALLEEIENFDALPSVEEESTLPVTPLAPTGEGQ
ncbi:MAG: zf-HC2 domain-containing protein [Gemmatimonadaceae bacterium]